MLEPWTEFLKRTAAWTERALRDCSIEPWLTQWRRRKWRWAAKVMEEGSDKWTKLATQWQPWLHTTRPAGRRQARPKRRWEQDFIDFLSSRGVMEVGQTWRELACNAEAWRSFEDEFAKQFEHR